MEKESYMVGDQFEKFCTICNKQAGHVVKTLTKQGNISKTLCSQCGTLSAFKETAKDKTKRELSTKSGAPYDRTKTYRTGQVMIHPNFGVGEVTEVFPANTIDVLFLDRVRRLIHSRV